jgi:hypothetical protein
MRLRRGSRGQYGSRASDHGILAITQPGGTGVIGFTRNLDPPSTMRPEAIPDRNGTTQIDQAATLLDMQLNERPNSSEGLGISAEFLRLPSSRSHGLSHGEAVHIL